VVAATVVAATGADDAIEGGGAACKR